MGHCANQYAISCRLVRNIVGLSARSRCFIIAAAAARATEWCGSRKGRRFRSVCGAKTGLDGGPEYKESWDAQLSAFTRILRLCEKAGGRVLTIHSRRAARQVLDTLAEYPHVGLHILYWFSAHFRSWRGPLISAAGSASGPPCSSARRACLGLPNAAEPCSNRNGWSFRSTRRSDRHALGCGEGDRTAGRGLGCPEATRLAAGELLMPTIRFIGVWRHKRRTSTRRRLMGETNDDVLGARP